MNDGGLFNRNGIAKHGDTAYFAGSGPPGDACAGCAHFQRKVLPSGNRSEFGKCLKAAQMRGCKPKALAWIKDFTAACKYFERKA